MFHRPIHNLFFALRPPPPKARTIAMAAERLGTGGVPADRLHVTLFILPGLPGVPERLLAALRDIGATIAMAPFEVSFDRLVGSDGYVSLRPSRRIEALAALNARLATLASTAGMRSERHRFSPHLSLFYRGGATVNERIAPIGWTAAELLLIDSHVGFGRHKVEGSWPLVGESEPQLSLF